MKKLLLNFCITIPFLLIWILSYGSISDTTKSTKPEYKVGNIISQLNGNVKSIVEYMYPFTTNESGMIIPDFSEKDPWYYHTVNFKEDGKTESSDIGRFSGGLNIEYVSYNVNGSVLEMIHYYGNNISNIIICEYDNRNNLILEKYLSPSKDKVEMLQNYKYNESNCITLTKSYRLSGEVLSKSQYTYEINNNLVSWNAYSYEDGIMISQRVETFYYVFDDHKNWVYQYRYIDDELDSINVRRIEYY